MERKICAILPYKELYDIAKKCKNEYFPEIEIKEGNIDGAIYGAQQAEKEGAEVIISRGGTSAIIRKNVNIPVVEIKVSYLDLLKTLYPFRDANKNLLVVGFKNAVYRCKAISDVLSINLKKIIIPYEADKYDFSYIEKEAEQIKKEFDIDAIIGDQTAVIKLGHLFHMSCLITSGIDDMIEAIKEAENLLDAKHQEKEKSKRFQAVIDFISDGVMSTDENGILTVFNPTAEKIFDLKKEMAIGKHISDVIKKDFSSKIIEEARIPELECIVKSPNGSIMINRIPIVVEEQIKGVVTTFKEISKIQGAEQKIRENMYTKGFATRYKFDDILTKDTTVKETIQMAKDYSKTDVTILIQGESGTGKEIFAQSIHANSNRANGPFIAVNCAALPPQLLESELFGYVEGSFTGASKTGKIGLFEMSHNGTVFLDEIGDLDKSLQSRFLRVLEEKQIMRIGSDKIIHINVRVIAATNRNLRDQVEKGNFRSDLYYRLNVLNIHAIPLRERKGDIEFLVNHFIRVNNKKYGFQVDKLSEDVIELLKAYSWPGNIRELRNAVERIVLTTRKEYIRLEDIKLIANEFKINIEKKAEDTLDGTLKEVKNKIVAKVLKEEGYNKSKAAKRLGIDRSTIDRLL